VPDKTTYLKAEQNGVEMIFSAHWDEKEEDEADVRRLHFGVRVKKKGRCLRKILLGNNRTGTHRDGTVDLR